MIEQQARTIPLTILLVALSIGSLLVVLSNAWLWHRLVLIYPPWLAYAFGIIGALRLLAVVGLWINSRAAVLLYVVLSMAVVSLYASVGVYPQDGLIGIGSALLLALMVWSKWQNMPWLAG